MEEINELKTKRKEIMDKKYSIGELAIGTIQIREGICGKPNCKCKRGRPHGPYSYLAFSSKEKGKIISIYISKNELPVIKKKLENYQKLNEYIEKLLLIELKIKKIQREKN